VGGRSAHGEPGRDTARGPEGELAVVQFVYFVLDDRAKTWTQILDPQGVNTGNEKCVRF